MKGAERVWVVAAQASLRKESDFERISRELQLIDYYGVLCCRRRLNNSQLGT